MPTIRHSASITRRFVTALTGVLVVGLSTVAAPVASATPEARADRVSSAGRLYVQSAASAVATRSPNGAYTLTLRGVDPKTRWFTDRPARQAGSQATTEFIRQWRSNGFASVPPNAVVEVGDDNGRPVTLRDPRYDARLGSLTYTVTPINGRSLPRVMQRVALFIDDGGSVQQQVTFTVANLSPGMQFQISVSSANDAVTFTSGPSISAMQPVPIVSTAMTPSSISIATGATTGSSGMSMQINAIVTSAIGPSDFTLQASAAPGVSITAQVGPTAPVTLTASPTTFTWTS